MWRNRITRYADVPPDQLLANPKNWRIHPRHQQDALAGIIDEVGFVDPVLVQDGTDTVIDGHLRVSLALRDGVPTIPVAYVDLDDDESDLVLATFDPITALANADRDNLDALLRNLSAEDESVQRLLADLAEQEGIVFDAPAGLTDPDAVPEVPKEAVTRPGDVWVLGRHRIGCLDSTNPDAVDLLLNGKAPDFVFADPPYGIDIVDTKGWVGGTAAYNIPFGGVKNKKGLGTANGSKPFGSKGVRGTVGASNMVEAGRYAPVIGDDSTRTAIDAFALAYSLAPSAVHVWWGGNYYANALPPSSCWIVWDKENTGNFADAELAWTNRPTVVRIFRHMWNGLMKDSERGEQRVHPTQKPVALAEWCFENYGKDGDVIFDPFVGSGMSVIAAEGANRTVYGCEMSPEYCDVIVTRWQDFTGSHAVLATAVAEAAAD